MPAQAGIHVHRDLDLAFAGVTVLVMPRGVTALVVPSLACNVRLACRV